jgi:two-component system, NtrC family, sensor kinase
MNQGKRGKGERLPFAEDLIENLPVGIVILDQTGKIIRMNRKQEEVSQVRKEKILGRTFAEAFPNALDQGLKASYDRLLKSAVPFDIIIDGYTPQYYPKKLTYRSRGAAFSSRKHFMILNEHEEVLSQEKRLVEKRTEELEESKNFLESLIDASPNLVISTDLDGRILIFNRTAEKAFGYMKEEVMNEKIELLFKEGEDPSPPPSPKEIRCIRKNQNSFPASLLVSDIKNIHGRPIAKLYLLADLTERKEMEERLFLSEKLALYTEWMGGIAHQLNNPLIGVVNFSQMLLKEMEEKDPQKELAETISRAGKECIRIITSILNCLKDPYLNFAQTDIHEVLHHAVHALREQFREKLNPIAIQTAMDPRVFPINGDGIQLKQCFLNILINAVQAMPDGNGTLRVATQYDEIKNEVRIAFSDTGIGIPREHLGKIFLPLFSLKKSAGRHGLGLSFAYQIAKNHGGHINVESEEGVGSTFTIILPAAGNGLKGE